MIAQVSAGSLAVYVGPNTHPSWQDRIGKKCVIVKDVFNTDCRAEVKFEGREKTCWATISKLKFEKNDH